MRRLFRCLRAALRALLSQCVKSAEVILYPELGPEAVRRLEVEDFPVTVINDVSWKRPL